MKARTTLLTASAVWMTMTGTQALAGSPASSTESPDLTSPTYSITEEQVGSTPRCSYKMTTGTGIEREGLTNGELDYVGGRPGGSVDLQQSDSGLTAKGRMALAKANTNAYTRYSNLVGMGQKECGAMRKVVDHLNHRDGYKVSTKNEIRDQLDRNRKPANMDDYFRERQAARDEESASYAAPSTNYASSYSSRGSGATNR